MRTIITAMLLLCALAFQGCDAGRALAIAEAAAATAAERLEIKEEEIAKLRAGLDKAEELAAKVDSPEAQQIVAKAQALYEEAVLALPAVRGLAAETRDALTAARAAHDAGGGALQTIGIILGSFIPAAGVAFQQYSKAKREADRAAAAEAAERAAAEERRRYEAAARSSAQMAQRLKAAAPAPAVASAVSIAEAEQKAAGVQDIVDRLRELPAAPVAA